VAETRLGIDLGGTKIEAIILGVDGKTTLSKRVPTPKGDYRLVLESIQRLVSDILGDANIGDSLPLGIGTPGAISHHSGLMKNSNSTCLNDQPLKEDLEAILDRPVRIANDADCFTLSEARDGAGADADNVFGVILGTGAGGGICINQQLVQGVNSIAGEWGHNPLSLNNLKNLEHKSTLPDMDSRQCYCGQTNCVESWLAGPSFEKSYEILTSTRLNSPEIVKLAEGGDKVAAQILDQYHNMLALALANVINILDPAIIVLGGGMSNINSLYTEVHKHLEHYVFSDRVDTKIKKAVHGDASGVRGAAWLWP
jgi:predicted NBD/HSP70 family sugar kinase